MACVRESAAPCAGLYAGHRIQCKGLEWFRLADDHAAEGQSDQSAVRPARFLSDADCRALRALDEARTRLPQLTRAQVHLCRYLGDVPLQQLDSVRASAIQYRRALYGAGGASA